MLVRNNSKRLIILNGGKHTLQTKDGEILKVVPPQKYKILPGGGEADVPDEVVSRSFAKALVASGDLALVGPSAQAEPEEGIDALRDEAESLGVKVDKRWKADRLQKEIDAALNH